MLTLLEQNLLKTVKIQPSISGWTTIRKMSRKRCFHIIVTSNRAKAQQAEAENVFKWNLIEQGWLFEFARNNIGDVCSSENGACVREEKKHGRYHTPTEPRFCCKQLALHSTTIFALNRWMYGWCSNLYYMFRLRLQRIKRTRIVLLV